MKHRPVLIAALIAAAGCSDSVQSQRIAVASPNTLGVVAIEIDRVDDHGDEVFELRGVDGNDNELAAVRLRTGEIADLPNYLPGPNTHGSEIILSLGSTTTRAVSRELKVHQLQPQEPVMEGFLALAEVASALDQENIHTARATQNAETSYLASGCQSGQVMPSPLAGECCYNDPSSGSGTLFVNYGMNAYVYRQGPGTPCTAQDGSSCNGASCFYGPGGFGRPVVTTGSGTPRVVYTSFAYGNYYNSWCYGAFYSSLPSPAPPAYPDVSGTLTTTTCPGSDGGGGDWSY